MKYFCTSIIICTFFLTTTVLPSSLYGQCAAATTVTCGTNETGTTTGEPNAGLGTCGTSTGTGGMKWYTFVGDGNTWTFETVATAGQYDTKIWVYSGSCGALTCVTGNDDGGAGTLSLVNFITTASTNYYVIVGGFGGNQGNYNLNITATPCSPPTAMTYSSTTVIQASTATVSKSFVDQQILRVEVVTAGATSPLILDQLRINLEGSNLITDITNVNVYYTGNSTAFSTTTLFGSIAPPVATTTYANINGTQTLVTGSNYFWVAYDISSTAVTGNVVDGRIRQVVVSGIDRLSNVIQNPAGNRQIVGVTPTPGNVGTGNLTAWWKTDALTNGNVTSWTTSYPTGGSAITVTDASAPYPQATNTPTGDVSNYNTTIDFGTVNSTTSLKALENTSSLNLLDNASAGDQGTFLGNYYFPTFIDNNDHIMLYNETGNDGIQFRNLGASGRLALSTLGNTTNACRNWTENFLPTTISYKGNRSSAASMNQYENSKINITSSASACSGATGLYFGSVPGSATAQYKGYLNEFIFFNRDLTFTEMLKIDTYLAVKYGITLDNTGGVTQGDYIATNGSIIWDASINTGYHNDVIGIGRDDNEALLQKQSHAFDDTTRIYLNTLAATNVANSGAFSSDASYIVAGHNNGAMCGTLPIYSEIPAACGLFSRIEREWKITKTNFSDDFSFDAKLNLCATPGSVVISELRFLVDDDGDFSNGGTTCYFNGDASGTIISYTNPTITISGISSIHITNNSTKYVTIASTNPTTPLPINLMFFNAKCENEKPVLNWSTSTETNNDYFTIEKSSDGINFKELVIVNGKGNNSSITNYKWSDRNSINGQAYYRLKQTDFDGTIKILETETAKCIEVRNISIYPNPTNKTLFIELGKNYEDVSVQVKNVLGQILQLKNYKSIDNIEFSLNGESGIYFVTISDNENKTIYHQKVVKQ